MVGKKQLVCCVNGQLCVLSLLPDDPDSIVASDDDADMWVTDDPIVACERSKHSMMRRRAVLGMAKYGNLFISLFSYVAIRDITKQWLCAILFSLFA